MANLRVDKIAATPQTAALYRLDAGAGTGMDPFARTSAPIAANSNGGGRTA
jgi:hypothetical protein